MATNRDPDGPGKIQMTRAWKDLVLQTLTRRGWSVERLAKEVGIARATAYRMLPAEPVDNEIWSSSAVPDICEVLGLPPPLEPRELPDREADDRDRKILALVRALPLNAKDSLITFIEGLLDGQKR